MRKIIIGSLILLMLHLSNGVIAQQAASAEKPTEVTVFDPTEAHKTLDRLSIKLSTAQLVISNLEEAVKILIDLQSDSEVCVKTGEVTLKEINTSLSAISSESDISKKLEEEQKYLQDKKKILNDRVSECRLFILRSQEAIDAFTKTIQQRVTTKLFKPEKRFWENFKKYPNPLFSLYSNFKMEKVKKNLGLSYFDQTNTVVASILLFMAVLYGFRIRCIMHRKIESQRDEDEEGFVRLVKLSLFNVVERYSMILVPLVVLSIAFGFITYSAEITQVLPGVIYGVTSYLLFVGFVRFIFCPSRRVNSFTQVPEHLAIRSFHRLEFLGIIALIGYFSYVIFETQNFPSELVHIWRSIFYIIFGFGFLNIVWVVNRLPKIQNKYILLRLAISSFISISLVLVIIAELWGYHNLALHIRWGNGLTVFLGVMLWLSNRLVMEIFDKFNQVKRPWQEKMRHYLTFGRTHALPEVIMLKFVCLFFVWVSFFALLVRYWTASDAQYVIFLNAFADGFAIAGVEIVPSKIIIGIIVFVLFALITRLVRSHIRRNVKIVKDVGGQEELATIIGYIGFAFALIFAMLVAGVNFTGITIIAGALSVGIGFGLQNIVGNFVSGIILLVERPIKVGDRIFVSGQEGRVKKISIRSTRVRAQNNADLIVPNNEIISSTVTNYMFGDRYFRVDIDIGVAYGSDIDLVKELLLQCANESEHVVKDVRSLLPRALFWAHGDSALIFQLRVNITDVNQRYNVQSDLNFAINKIFAEHNIEIPFPQTDIHVKEFPSAT